MHQSEMKYNGCKLNFLKLCYAVFINLQFYLCSCEVTYGAHHRDYYHIIP